jgi:hypothetical protein
VTVRNNRQILLITLYMPSSFDRGNSVISFPEKLKNLRLTLIFKFSPEQLKVQYFFLKNFSYNVVLKYRSPRINKMFMLCLTMN